MMDSKVCLIIIYNHNFERNIDVLERIYEGRFDGIYHVMPFYRGNKDNVIGVYENSYQFSGYIAQSLDKIKNPDFSHYFFVADDMVVAPWINQNNLVKILCLDESAAFISDYNLINDERFMTWSAAIPSFMNLLGGGNSVEYKNFLPDARTARDILSSHGVDCGDGVSARLFNVVTAGCRVMRRTPQRYSLLPPLGVLRKHHSLLASEDKIYPLVDGYSDFIAVPSGSIEEFRHYCGMFAALRVFVEIAIPMALLFSCRKIVRLRDIGMKAENGVDDYSVRRGIEEKYDLSYEKLLSGFPEDYLYVHPVKLSRWKDLP